MTTRPDTRLTTLAEQSRDEALAILQLLPALFDAQWAKSERPDSDRPEPEDAGIRGKGGPPSDPTGDIATDPHRLRIRSELRVSDRHLLHAFTLLRGSRAALERALCLHEGTCV